MFLKSVRKDPPSKEPAAGLQGSEVDSYTTFISADTKVGGNLTGVGEVRIDGEVGGNVYGRRVSVGADGLVLGDINAEVADIAGTVRGRIEAVTVSLASSAEVNGTVTHNELDIASGAKLGDLRPWRPPSFFDKKRNS